MDVVYFYPVLCGGKYTTDGLREFERKRDKKRGIEKENRK